MKKKALVAYMAMIMVVFTIISGFGQTAQEKKQIRLLDKEIKKEQWSADRLETKLRVNSSDSAYSVSLQYRIDSFKLESKRRQVADLRNERNNIFLGYATATEVPQEISKRILKRRQRANILRREELVLYKIENDLGAVDPSEQHSGYKIILDNNYSDPVVFLIIPDNGGNRMAACVASRQKTTVYLLPGDYTVVFEINGRAVGCPKRMSVTGATHIYQGEECFAFAYMPRW